MMNLITRAQELAKDLTALPLDELEARLEEADAVLVAANAEYTRGCAELKKQMLQVRDAYEEVSNHAAGVRLLRNMTDDQRKVLLQQLSAAAVRSNERVGDAATV